MPTYLRVVAVEFAAGANVGAADWAEVKSVAVRREARK